MSFNYEDIWRTIVCNNIFFSNLKKDFSFQCLEFFRESICEAFKLDIYDVAKEVKNWLDLICRLNSFVKLSN